MSRYIDIDKVDFMMADGDAEFNKGVTKCIQILNNAPTEDVRPVVRGEWVIDDKEGDKIWHCHCSNCQKDPQDYVGGTENWWLVRLPDYCPNCGADMREVEE